MGTEVLRVVSGRAAGDEIAVDSELVLGRDQAGEGALGGDDELSRRHARIRRADDGTLTIEDLGSTNGTRLNGDAITGAARLRAGDRIEIGASELELVDPHATVARDRPEGARATKIVSPAPAAAEAPPFRAPRRQPELTHPAVRSSGAGPPRLLIWGGAALIAAVVAIVAVLLMTGGGGGASGSGTSGGATVASDCGANPGGGEPVGYVAYVESNDPATDDNSVVAMPYRAGNMKPLAASRCPTGGSGSTNLTNSAALDADNQVLLSPDHRLLFAVNQGSDTIAVFHVAADGALSPVSGSPFASGGKAPASVGLDGNTLVVANKAYDGARDLANVEPTYTSFKVSRDGALHRVQGSVITADPGSAPSDAYISPSGGLAFSTAESGPLRAMRISSDGSLTQGPNSPLDLDPRIFGSGFNPAKEFGLGIAAVPHEKGLYIGMPAVPAVAVYAYNAAGALRYVSSVPVRGAYLPCWIVVTPNGRWMYTSDPATNNVVAFDVGTDPALPRQIQTVAFDQTGTPWNEALDPAGKYLFVNAIPDPLTVPEGEGNIQHVLRIGADGKLHEVATSPAKIPVKTGANPLGLAVLPVGG